MSENIEVPYSVAHQIMRAVLGDKLADRVLNTVDSEEEAKDRALYFQWLNDRLKKRDAPEVQSEAN